VGLNTAYDAEVKLYWKWVILVLAMTST
jgi:hypothetical protein